MSHTALSNTQPDENVEDYDNVFFENMARAYFEQTPWSRLRLTHVRLMVDPQSGDRIIDLGCGMGSISHFCALHGAQVVGVDASAVGIDQARGLFSDRTNVTFLVRNVADLYGLESESFDKAVSCDLVEHIHRNTWEAMAQEAYRVLKRGGNLFIYTPCPTHIVERMKAHNFILKQNPTHIDLKPKEYLISTLEATGFQIETLYFTPTFLPVLSLFERAMMKLPVVGAFFRYRTCINAIKPG